jgi:crotonobetainyl-CoA:carnitine CoA-transferase CaiB-like acyl-CoA transferase
LTERILDGLRVVDLSQGLSGPVASMLLGVAGADVVKVEPPGGDFMRGTPAFATWNREKRSVELDLRTEAGRRDLEAILTGADVLIHNLRPASARRLALDPDALAARHPALIVCAVPGWPTGHPAADRPSYDSLVMARAGLMDEQHGHRDGPIFIRFPLGSWGGAWLGACGVLARLQHRRRTGRGGVANTSILQGSFPSMLMHWSRAEHPSEAFAAGLPKVNRPSLWECSDGVWLHLMHSPDHTPLMQQLLAEMGEEAVAEANAGHADTRPNPNFPNFGADGVLMRRRPSDEWLTQLWEHDVPAQPAVPLGQIFFDEQANVNGYVVEIDDPEWGPVRQAGIPFATTPAAAITRAAPRLGEHTAEVLAEAGDRPRPVPAPSASGAGTGDGWPLEGLKVLDLGNYLAGPLAPMLLADLGADVVKLESTTGDPMRWVARVFDGCQRNKRSVAVDLRDASTRPIVEALAGWADVVHHNLRMPAARKLGVDYESLRPVNPEMIYCHVSSYGPVGPRADWPGYDQLFQASCGWEFEGAGEGNPPMWHRFGMMDHQCAMASLYAVLLGLEHKGRTGDGQFVAASLLGAALLTCSETLVQTDGRLAPFPRLDHEQTGVGPAHRIYEALDGWLAVAAVTAEASARLRSALAVDGLEDLEPVVASRKREEVLAALEAAGVPAEPVHLDQLDAFLDDSRNVEIGLVARYRHARYGVEEQLGALWDFGDLSCRMERAAPVIGQHTRDVLTDLGFESPALDELRDRGAIVWP